MTQRSKVEVNEYATTPLNQSGTGSTVSNVADQAKETAGQVADQTKQAASQVAGQVREQATSRIAAQKDNAAAGLTTVADALRQTGDQLREQNPMGITSYIDSAASQVEQFSTYLQEHDLGQLVDEVEYFARRRPTLFLGGAFVLGLLGARFLKSSRQQLPSSNNYPIARRDIYTRTQGIYDQPYQQPYRGETTYGTTTYGTTPGITSGTTSGINSGTTTGTTGTTSGTTSGTWPTTDVEDQL